MKRFAAPILASLLLAGSAEAATLPGAVVSLGTSKARVCAARLLSPGTGVTTTAATAAHTGALSARVRGGGDWDIAVFGDRGRYVAGGAGPSDDLAQGFVREGERLTIQLCRFGGEGARARVTLDNTPLAASTDGFTPQVVAVRAPTRAAKDRLGMLGLDPAEGATATTVDVVLHDAAEASALTSAGFTYTVRIADLAARDRANARADRAYAERVNASELPSKRTEYRHLADYEGELKLLAQQHPGLVRLVELPHKSLLKRTILGVEIAKDVNASDGRPTFVQLGVHHAREWPAGENPMEWAYEMINGYGKDERVTRIVDNLRTVVVPIVNPDGFNLTREAPVDAGNGAAAVDIPEEVDNPDVLPITDPTYTSALLLDQNAGTFAYKRRNCRIKDGADPAAGECENRDNRLLGTDPNRNYGGLWGGPGASLDPSDDTYRGAGPFSEPEVQNVRELISTRQATVMITNHTFTGLVLRPPGVRAQGPPIDEDAYKALGDAMAAQNGYKSEPGYQLYDTTGTTEDWSYPATGGFGFTFEIGKDEFHPPYSEMAAEYTGPTELGGPGGNRGAYFLAAEWAMGAANHSVLRGKAPAGTTLRLHKVFQSQTSPVITDATGKTSDPRTFEDVLDSTLEVGDAGTFAWHVNPSTRPAVAKDRRMSGVEEKPAKEIDISSPTPPLPKVPTLVEIDVPADAHRQIRAQTIGTVPVDDIDIYLYEGSVNPDNQVSSSAGGTADETIVFDNPKPGTKYILEIRNFAAVGPYDGKVQLMTEKPGSEVLTKATTEDYVLTCERGGKVLRTDKVFIARGAEKDLGDVCSTAIAAGTSKLKLSAAFDRRTLKRALASGLRVRVRCRAVACATLRAVLSVDGKTAKRLGLAKTAKRTIVARAQMLRKVSGRRTFTVRFTAKARRALARERSVHLTLTAYATDSARRKVSRTVGLTLRR